MGLGSLVVFERQQRLVTVQAWVLQLDVEACSVFLHTCASYFSRFLKDACMFPGLIAPLMFCVPRRA